MITTLIASMVLSGTPPAWAPIDYKRISSMFGYRKADKQFHPGVDLVASVGTPVHCTGEGVVTYAGKGGGYGMLLIIDHGDGIKSWYGHLSKILVRKGEWVSFLQRIALVGNSGKSTGPHLHLEIRLNGHPIDPAPLIFDRDEN